MSRCLLTFFLVRCVLSATKRNLSWMTANTARYERADLHSRIFILFRAAEKEIHKVKVYPFNPHIIFVNVPFTYAIYFFFLCDQKEKVPKRKKSPPKTDLALLRLPMTARQIRFAQTPLDSVISKLRIRSLTGRPVCNRRYYSSCIRDYVQWKPCKPIKITHHLHFY